MLNHLKAEPQPVPSLDHIQRPVVIPKFDPRRAVEKMGQVQALEAVILPEQIEQLFPGAGTLQQIACRR